MTYSFSSVIAQKSSLSVSEVEKLEVSLCLGFKCWSVGISISWGSCVGSPNLIFLIVPSAFLLNQLPVISPFVASGLPTLVLN